MGAGRRLEEVDVYLGIAAEISSADDVIDRAVGTSVRALLASSRGEHERAEALAREAIRLFADAQAPNADADLWTVLSVVLEAAGNVQRAAQAAAEALDRFERKGNVPMIERGRGLVGRLWHGAEVG